MQPVDASGYVIDDGHAIMDGDDVLEAGLAYWAYIEEDCIVTVVAGAL